MNTPSKYSRRILAYFLLVCFICASLPAFAEACGHASTYTEYDEVECWTYDMNDHVISQPGYEICADCGETVDWFKDEYLESHRFGSDGTCVCGYENAVCMHPIRNDERPGEIEAQDWGDPDRHELVQWIYTYCGVCGDLVDENGDPIGTEAHDFSGNTCRDCGYTRTAPSCDHAGKRELQSSRIEPNGSKDTHNVANTYRVYCECGYLDTTAQETVTEACVFVENSGIQAAHEPGGHQYYDQCKCGNARTNGRYESYLSGCSICENANTPEDTCDHTEMYRLLASEISSSSTGSDTHYVLNTYLVYCECGQVDTTIQETAGEACTFIKNSGVSDKHETEGHQYYDRCKCGNTRENGRYKESQPGCAQCEAILEEQKKPEYQLKFESDYYIPASDRLYLDKGESAGFSVINVKTGESVSLSKTPGLEIYLQSDDNCASLKGYLLTGQNTGSGTLVLKFDGEIMDTATVCVSKAEINEYGWWLFTLGETQTVDNVVTLKQMESIDWEEHGMVLTDSIGIFNFSAEETDDGYLVAFDAYNDSPMIVGIAAYDEDGNKLDTHYINPQWDKVSITDAFWETAEGIASMGDGIAGNSKFLQKKTSVELSVPANGHISVLTADEDDEVLALNLVELFYGWTSLSSNIKKLSAQSGAASIADTTMEYRDEIDKDGFVKSVLKAIKEAGIIDDLRSVLSGNDFSKMCTDIVKLLWGTDVNLFTLAFENLPENIKSLALNIAKKGATKVEDSALKGFDLSAYMVKTAGNVAVDSAQLVLWCTQMQGVFSGSSYQSIDYIVMPYSE